MNRFPFSAYDFFGYLASGFLVLAAHDHATDGGWLLRRQLSATEVFLLVTVAYIVGHIIANVSGFLLESWMVRRVLRSPEDLLFGTTKRSTASVVFPGYFKPLPRATQDRILEMARTRGGPQQPGRALFLHCFGVVKRDESTLARLGAFLNMYGFCRNACLACMVAALMFLNEYDRQTLGWLAVAASVGMFYRYLKFFRQYTYEVFVTYAETVA